MNEHADGRDAGKKGTDWRAIAVGGRETERDSEYKDERQKQRQRQSETERDRARQRANHRYIVFVTFAVVEETWASRGSGRTSFQLTPVKRAGENVPSGPIHPSTQGHQKERNTQQSVNENARDDSPTPPETIVLLHPESIQTRRSSLVCPLTPHPNTLDKRKGHALPIRSHHRTLSAAQPRMPAAFSRASPSLRATTQRSLCVRSAYYTDFVL